MALLFALLLGAAIFLLQWLMQGIEAGVSVEVYAHARMLSHAMMALMVAVILISFAISYFVVNRINRIAVTAHEIVATKDLSRRIAMGTQWDDLSKLAQLLNRFLEQMETQMTSVREVSNNIAHDLRTPLAGLRSDIESLKGHPVDEQQLDGLIAQADTMMGVFQSLLRITNIEQGKRAHAFEVVDIGRLMLDVIELYEPVAEEKEIRIEASLADGARVRGDADLLFQVFTNLLDNAVKFSPHASQITVTVALERGSVMVTLMDRGPGISDADKAHVFKHFYRGDASRSTEGNGLGLSLVKAIVAQHQGEIRLEDAMPGLNVTVRLLPYQ